MVSLFKELPSPTVPRNCKSLPPTQNDSAHKCINISAAASAPRIAPHQRKRAAMHLGLIGTTCNAQLKQATGLTLGGCATALQHCRSALRALCPWRALPRDSNGKQSWRKKLKARTRRSGFACITFRVQFWSQIMVSRNPPRRARANHFRRPFLL